MLAIRKLRNTVAMAQSLWKWWETALPSGEIGRSNGSEITSFDQLPPLPIINDPTAPLTPPTCSIPEPATLALLGLCLAVLEFLQRKKKA